MTGKKEITPLPAATIALVRDARDGLEILMLQRSFQSGFMPGVHVFPGGGLDPGDESPEAHERSAGPADPEASRRLGIERGGLAYFIAAIRESFEEAGSPACLWRRGRDCGYARGGSGALPGPPPCRRPGRARAGRDRPRGEPAAGDRPARLFQSLDHPSRGTTPATYTRSFSR